MLFNLLQNFFGGRIFDWIFCKLLFLWLIIQLTNCLNSLRMAFWVYEVELPILLYWFPPVSDAGYEGSTLQSYFRCGWALKGLKKALKELAHLNQGFSPRFLSCEVERIALMLGSFPQWCNFLRLAADASSPTNLPGNTLL